MSTQAKPNTAPVNLIHESKIPPIASKACTQPAHPHPNGLTTSLSFALPTSLAFFKRITWELTPWTHPNIDFATASTISAHIPSLPADAIHSALCLGVAYTGATNAPKHHQPRLYVVFPRLRRPLDDATWRFWHTEIVKPAFDEAWIASDLVGVWEDADASWVTRRAAPSAEQVVRRFYNAPGYRRCRPQHVEWPAWEDVWEFSTAPDAWVLGKGVEGGFADRRARVLDAAWLAMRDMLNAGGEVGEMSGPVLLAVWGKRVAVGEDVAADVLVRMVGKEWDAYVDSRFVEKDMFVVQVEGARRQLVLDQQEQGQLPLLHQEGQDQQARLDGSPAPARWKQGLWTVLRWALIVGVVLHLVMSARQECWDC